MFVHNMKSCLRIVNIYYCNYFYFLVSLYSLEKYLSIRSSKNCNTNRIIIEYIHSNRKQHPANLKHY